MARNRRNKKSKSEKTLVDRFLFRLGSKIALGLFVAVVFLTLIQCTVKKPESPSWTTHATVPAVNRTYPMEELVEMADQEGLEMDGTGNVTYTISEDLDTVRLEDDILTTANISYVTSERVGIVTIDAPPPSSVTIALSAISGLASSLPGDQAMIGAGSFSVYNTLPLMEEFTEATVENGHMTVGIVNNLGVRIDSVVVSLYDRVLDRTVVMDTLSGRVDSGLRDSVMLTLAGETISNSMRIIVSSYTPGGIIPLASTRYLETDLSFSDGLDVSQAVARIPQIQLQFDQQVPLAESDRIDTASLASGLLDLAMTNMTGLEVSLSVVIPDLVELPSSTPLTIDTVVPAYQQISINRNLTGCSLIPHGSGLPQQMDIDVTALFPGSGDDLVAVSQFDSLNITADISALGFESVVGVFSGGEAAFNNIAVDIDIPTGFDSVQLVSAVLTLEILNAVDLPGALDVTLRGDNGKSLNLTGDITRGTTGSPVLSTIVNESVAEFLHPLPNLITASGTATYGDGLTPGKVTIDDFVLGHLDVVSPLEAIIHECVIETDVTGEEITQDDIDMITEHVIEANLVYNVVSHLPVGAGIELYFSSDSATVFSDPELIISGIRVDAAPVSAAGIVVDTQATGYQEIVLSNDDIQILANPVLWAGQRITLEDTGGESVRLMAADFITLTGRIEVDYLFDGEF